MSAVVEHNKQFALLMESADRLRLPSPLRVGLGGERIHLHFASIEEVGIWAESCGAQMTTSQRAETPSPAILFFDAAPDGLLIRAFCELPVKNPARLTVVGS